MSNREANTLVEFYTSLMKQTAEKMRDLSTDAANELQQVFDQLEDRCFNVIKQVDVEYPRGCISFGGVGPKLHEPKQDYPRGGIVSGKDVLDALHMERPKTIIPLSKLKEILNEPQYINPFMDLETAEIAARNKRYSSYQIVRGWVVPNEDKNWWGVLLRPAYKIMIPRTTGKTITDISNAVGNYGQNN